jgi:predicted tellurium resistance membrane protein TerC
VAEFFEPANLIALLTLTLLELVLGIDNIVFIAILTARVRKDQQKLAYRLGLGGALITRLGLLLSISWVMRLEDDLFTMPLLEVGISGRDIILFVGGLFLMAKAVHEIYGKLEGADDEHISKGYAGLWMTVAQIMVLDIVFSLDSVITAVGMVDHIPTMVVAMVIAVVVMLIGARPVGDFVNKHPSMKILALSFLLLIGVLLVTEALDRPIKKGYIYFAMAFSLGIELLNMRLRKKSKPVELHGPEVVEPGDVMRGSMLPPAPAAKKD